MPSLASRCVTAAAVALALLVGLGPADPQVTPAVAGTAQLAGTVGTVASTASAPYTLLQKFGGSAARWNPCQTVRWAFNPAGAPTGGVTVVRTALARVSRLTGLRFQYVGTSRSTPGSAYLRQAWGAYRPLLIAWSDPSHSDLLAGTGPRHVGETRVGWVGLNTPLGLRAELTSGVVVFNNRSPAPLWGPASRYTIALHELGHAVGLGHVRSSQNLMGTVIPAALRDYGSGDRAGLLRVSARLGCLPALR
ncbi:MAG: hypothetical protein JWM02_2290 [Frankiales bacterium]|nr:hypothetical protein [Frankiales bacterium]